MSESCSSITTDLNRDGFSKRSIVDSLDGKKDNASKESTF
jgi:hypothetical protein